MTLACCRDSEAAGQASWQKKLQAEAAAANADAISRREAQRQLDKLATHHERSAQQAAAAAQDAEHQAALRRHFSRAVRFQADLQAAKEMRRAADQAAGQAEHDEAKLREAQHRQRLLTALQQQQRGQVRSGGHASC